MFRYCFLSLLIAMTLAGPGVSHAQDCAIAVYADPGGTQSWLEVDPAWDTTREFSVFVVLFAEDTVKAVAYRMSIENLGTTIFISDRIAGPNGSGLILDEDPANTGTNVALGECVFGFGAEPVLIEEYRLVAIPSWWGSRITLAPNLHQNPDFPEYVTCTDVQKTCPVGTPLDAIVTPVESTSFGAIKNLYR